MILPTEILSNIKQTDFFFLNATIFFYVYWGFYRTIERSGDNYVTACIFFLGLRIFPYRYLMNMRVRIHYVIFPRAQRLIPLLTPSNGPPFSSN